MLISFQICEILRLALIHFIFPDNVKPLQAKAASREKSSGRRSAGFKNSVYLTSYTPTWSE